MNIKYIGVIGSGTVGFGLAKHLTNTNCTVLIAHEKNLVMFNEVAILFKNSVKAVNQEELIRLAQVIFVAVPCTCIQAVAEKINKTNGKIIIDATNNILTENYFKRKHTGAMYSVTYPEQLFDTNHVVKAFNTLTAEKTKNMPSKNTNKKIVFLSGKDYTAKQIVTEIISLMGFEIVDLGTYKDSENLLKKVGFLGWSF